ncbi:conserved hypothetical protein [Hyphomicrobium denitrificans ATCC 51888]|uniref:Uncharacterized protein n=1 Tax=Hyphomicrobium denitrificans (strain ATCC 51888 / DSM 1869 / NCIMB 11706 / TK 0415) TaxID=582899 RepID=D8JQ19_HYPDA|nr:hypothetical protein [Hyphomicrobium denitrificans]ADJ21940.1 conserved hypothetical protein [Hyphomicrobium denitrificans ATCC 51888]ADJ23345.1 conserved hypothetical protein [Hyphomicrobium denitrificans ATCC 51888]
MPAEVGKYPNGDTFVRVRLSQGDYSVRIDATVEGSGKDADVATEMLHVALRNLSDMASDAADAMGDGEEEAKHTEKAG